jgi:hypothetical protein
VAARGARAAGGAREVLRCRGVQARPDLERLRRVLINAQIAALLVAEFVQKIAGLSKKQQLTHVL